MNELANHYQNAKLEAKKFMKNGQINAYLNSLLKLKKYKRLMYIILAN